jgi:sec-independent protein translocase protein TatC
MRNRLSAFWQRLTSPFRKAHSFLTEEPDDRPFVDALVDTVQSPGMLWEHVNDLRKHIFRALLVTIMATLITLIFTRQIMAFLAVPVGGLRELQAIEVTENISVFMRIGFLTGLGISIPYIAFELWLFAAPGLSTRARRYGLLGIPLTLIFFFGGAAFAYYLMLPTALPFLLNFMGIKVALRPASYFLFVANMLFWIGIAFEFPLVIYVLSVMGLVKPKMLKDNWRIAVVVIAIIAAVITPTVDPVNMFLVMAPMVLLYLLSIGLSYIATGKKQESSEN